LDVSSTKRVNSGSSLAARQNKSTATVVSKIALIRITRWIVTLQQGFSRLNGFKMTSAIGEPRSRLLPRSGHFTSAGCPETCRAARDDERSPKSISELPIELFPLT